MSPTATRLSFAFFLLVTSPCFGLCGAVARRGSLRSSALGFVMAAGGASFALFMSGLIAASVFPGYPLQGPPEHTASLFLVPPHIVGFALVVALGCVRRSRADPTEAPADAVRLARWPVACSLLLVGLLGLSPPAVYLLFVPPVQRALPWAAKDVRVSTFDFGGFNGDFTYCVKARVAPEDVPAYIARLGLTPYSASRRYDEPPSWAHPFPPSEGAATWWDPPAITESAWVHQQRDTHCVVAYRDGWLYAGAHAH